MTDREALDKAQKELNTASYLEETSPYEGLKTVHRNKIAWLARVLRLARKALNIEENQKRPKTNADRIRAMSDEELAVFMFSMVDCVSCQNKLMGNGKLVFGAERKTCTDKDYYAMCGGDGRKCESVCLQWLQQPAEEIAHDR